MAEVSRAWRWNAGIVVEQTRQQQILELRRGECEVLGNAKFDVKDL